MVVVAVMVVVVVVLMVLESAIVLSAMKFTFANMKGRNWSPAPVRLCVAQLNSPPTSLGLAYRSSSIC